ncbi:myc-associated zinc finger protein isoform X2 [Anabrus simplex]|uniref:myc-associated zinc finger protein isoform X2 n=1 Tax=Anabrus simplex TaxID=316456 RepID=UPI0035A34425
MLDLKKICTFCGSTEDVLLYNVFEPNEELNAYSVVQGDVICHRCLYSVNSFYFFKEFTTQTYKSLHKTIEKLCSTPDNKTDADDASDDVQILEEKIQEQSMVKLPDQQLPANPATAPRASSKAPAANPETASKASPKAPAANPATTSKASPKAPAANPETASKATPKAPTANSVTAPKATPKAPAANPATASKATPKAPAANPAIAPKATPKAPAANPATTPKATPKAPAANPATASKATPKAPAANPAIAPKATPKAPAANPATAPKATPKAPAANPATAPKAAPKAPAANPATAPKAAPRAPAANPATAPKAAPRAPEMVVIDIPGSSGTSKNITNQRAPLNNNEPVRKGKRPWTSPMRTASIRLKCHEEQHAASLDFRNELIEVNNSLVSLEEASSVEGRCNVCLKIFANTYSLKRHLVSHSSLRPFVCQICDKTFKDHSYLVKHERIHSRPVKRLTCVYCDLPFTQQSSLDKHVKNTHFADNKSDSDVEVTTQVVVGNNSDDGEVSSSPEHPVVCRLCLRTFRDVEGLNKHRAVHEKEVFQCGKCQETFSEQSNLEKHRNYLHSVCETCLRPKLYECCCESKRRKRTANRLICPHCSRAFPDSFDLAMHMRRCRTENKNIEKEIVLID